LRLNVAAATRPVRRLVLDFYFLLVLEFPISGIESTDPSLGVKRTRMLKGTELQPTVHRRPS
jgi:hypothetical protein